MYITIAIPRFDAMNHDDNCGHLILMMTVSKILQPDWTITTKFIENRKTKEIEKQYQEK